MEYNKNAMQSLLREAEQELDNYTGAQAENRYDDEDGYDEDGYDEDGYDEDGYYEDGYDEEYFEQRPQARRKKINPNDRSVKVIIQNATGGSAVETVKLFGGNRNPASAIPAGITITMPLVEGGYPAFLEQIKVDTAKTTGARLKYSDAANSSFPIKLLGATGYGTGNFQTILPDDYVDNYAQNEKIVNIPQFDFLLSGNDVMELQIPDNSTMEITLYVTARNDQSNVVKKGTKAVETLKGNKPRRKVFSKNR